MSGGGSRLSRCEISLTKGLLKIVFNDGLLSADFFSHVSFANVTRGDR